jgi:hypothetical protein
MKQAKITKKLSFNKLTVSNLNLTTGAAAAPLRPYTDPCSDTNQTCYQYSCPGWTNCVLGLAC